MKPNDLLLIALGILVLSGCAEAVKARANAGFRYAFVTPTCAPWDGPATRIVLQKSPVTMPKDARYGPTESYPTLAINLWIQPPPLNQWIPLEDQKGSASRCTGSMQCQLLKARLRLTSFNDKLIEGELREIAPDGPELSYPFKATVYTFRQFCG